MSSALGTNGSTRRWREIRQRIVRRDRLTCQGCGKVTLRGEVDHILPRHLGGSDHPQNLRYLCYDCHKARRGAVIQHSPAGHAAAVPYLHTQRGRAAIPTIRGTMTKAKA